MWHNLPIFRVFFFSNIFPLVWVFLVSKTKIFRQIPPLGWLWDLPQNYTQFSAFRAPFQHARPMSECATGVSLSHKAAAKNSARGTSRFNFSKAVLPDRLFARTFCVFHAYNRPFDLNMACACIYVKRHPAPREFRWNSIVARDCNS